MRTGAASVVAFAAILGCGSFSGTPSSSSSSSSGTPSNDAGDRPGASCQGSCAGTNPGWCYAYSFDTCPGDWVLEGDPAATHECSAGTIHLAARDTLDAFASVAPSGPPNATSLTVSARIKTTVWSAPNDDNRIVQVKAMNTVLFVLKAGTMSGGNIGYVLCVPGSGCDDAHPFESAPGVEHLFTVKVEPSQTSLAVDCSATARRAGNTLESNATVDIEFGARDGDPVDATFDDVMLSFQ